MGSDGGRGRGSKTAAEDRPSEKIVRDREMMIRDREMIVRDRAMDER